MAKNHFISLLFLFAFSLLFLHSVIPHHHHEANPGLHTGTDDDDHDDFDQNPLSHAFGHFQHDGGGIVIYENTSLVQYAKINIEKQAFLIVRYFLNQHDKPPLLRTERYFLPHPTSPFLVCHLFRGPPAAVA